MHRGRAYSQGRADDLGEHRHESLPELRGCGFDDRSVRRQPDPGLGIVVETLRVTEVLDSNRIPHAPSDMLFLSGQPTTTGETRRAVE